MDGYKEEYLEDEIEWVIQGLSEPWTKEEVLYLEQSPEEYASKDIKCNTCSFYNEQGSCELVNDTINPEGYCRFWVKEYLEEADSQEYSLSQSIIDLEKDTELYNILSLLQDETLLNSEFEELLESLVIDLSEEVQELSASLVKADKNPKGGLNAKGRAKYNSKGANLKPPVDKKPTTPEQLKRQGMFLSRMYNRDKIPPLKKPDGSSTRYALQACLHYDTPILLEDNSTLPIGYIVDNKLDLNIKCIDESTGKIKVSKIIDWKATPSSIDEFIVIGASATPLNQFNNSRFLTLTKDHRVFTQKGWIPAKETLGLERAYISQVPNKLLMEVLYGTLLGDSCIPKRTSNTIQTHYLTCTHAANQYELLSLKAKLFGSKENIKEIVNKDKQNHYTFNTKSLPCYKDIRQNWLATSGRKGLPLDLEEIISPLSLAFWVMDDGSLFISKTNTDKRYRLHTEGFQYSDIERLSNLLKNKFRINNIISKREHKTTYYTIDINYKDSISKLSLLISPYVIPELNYKLLPEHRVNFTEYNLTDFYFEDCISYIPITEHKVAQYGTNVHRNLSSYNFKYDITVKDYHNFIAAGTVVHNSVWNSPIPKNIEDVKRLAAKGEALLKRYQTLKDKSKKKQSLSQNIESIEELPICLSNGMVKIPVAKIGNWYHPGHGVVSFTQQDFEELKQESTQEVLGFTPYITYGHPTNLPYESVDAELKKGDLKGWEEENGVIFGLFDAKEDVVDFVKNGDYEYSSGEFIRNYKDKFTGNNKGTVLMRVALTNSPFIPFGDAKVELLSNNADFQESPLNKSSFVIKLSTESIKNTEEDSTKNNLIIENNIQNMEINAVTSEVVESTSLEVEKETKTETVVTPTAPVVVETPVVATPNTINSLDINKLVETITGQVNKASEATLATLTSKYEAIVGTLNQQVESLKTQLTQQQEVTQVFSTTLSQQAKNQNYVRMASQGVPPSVIQNFSMIESALESGQKVIKLSNSAGQLEEKSLLETIQELVVLAVNTEPVQQQQFGQSISVTNATAIDASIKDLIEKNKQAAVKRSI